MSMRAQISPEDILRRAYTVGNYYGFTPFPVLAMEARENKPTRKPYPKEISVSKLDPQGQVVASFLKQVRDAGITPSISQPLFAWHTNVTPGRNAPRHAVVQFHAIGAPHAIADAILMRVAQIFISDILKSQATLHINSVGDKETRVRYSRELGAYFRRNGACVPNGCEECTENDVYTMVEALLSHPDFQIKNIPSATDHLSEASRKHFENVLEFLEETDMLYKLSPDLVSRADMWIDTCFELRVNGKRIAWGSRYNDITSHFFENALPSVSVIIRINTKQKIVSSVREPTKPRAFFLHIGDEAKRASVRLTEKLRNAHIPIAQMIGVESLTEQMRIAESKKPLYILLMGRKEALDGTVILRSCDTHAETIIPLNTLVENLKTTLY